jgi:hypothetical protein
MILVEKNAFWYLQIPSLVHSGFQQNNAKLKKSKHRKSWGMCRSKFLATALIFLAQSGIFKSMFFLIYGNQPALDYQIRLHPKFRENDGPEGNPPFGPLC